MKILLLGSGGREHALAVKLKQSPLCTQLFIAPGNAGTLELGENCSFSVTDFDAIRSCCIRESIEMVVVGPEEPLVKGIVEFLRQTPGLEKLFIIGPGSQGAQLEGSKAFAKAFMQRNGIPTAAYREFDQSTFQEGLSYLSSHTLPIVLKADGLAAGKGVLICSTHQEAIQGFEEMIQSAKFGEAGKKVVVEEFLQGIEISVFVLTDGKNYVLLPEAKDYKRIGEGDTGLNTGGMGAVSPVPFVDAVLWDKIKSRVVEPTIQGLQKDGIPYCGFIFIGFMIVKDEPFVIEYNCRMGDPETEVVMPRLQTDLVELLAAAAAGELKTQTIKTDPRTACTVVAVSGGYPEDYKKGFPIQGLDQLPDSSLVFHMGTQQKGDDIITSGGRVLAVTAFGNTVSEAAAAARTIQDSIQFEGKYYRRDIGFEFK
ncbi:MAG: phosphoribosylamine--glycine ligase [Bacteroidetes bacterium]|nr:phosphoribosylamine--glycine ligase [Bacteroidota bacterium]